MVSKKLSTADEMAISDDQAAQSVTDSGAAAIPQVAPIPEPLPEPIVAIDQDGRQRPLSGGSFIRQPDGSIVRNEEA